MTDKASRAGNVHSKLREDILSGTFEPGERLAFATLVERYSCSIGVIREALQRLAERGLVDSQPAHGFRVRSISREDLTDLTVARQEIEVLALRYAVENGDTAWEAQLLAAHHMLSQTSQFDEETGAFSEAWASAHNGFHLALLEGCPNRRILDIACGLRDYAELYWRWSAPTYDRRRDIPREHKMLMKAAIARDVGQACELLHGHIGRTTDKLLAGIEAGQAALAQ